MHVQENNTYQYFTLMLQICRTYLNIAYAQEQGNVEYHDIQESYTEAGDHARKAKNVKLQV